jgi:hypothetical protein
MGEVNQVVGVLPEAGGAIVAALSDVHGDAGQDEPQLSGHSGYNDCPAARVDEFGL